MSQNSLQNIVRIENHFMQFANEVLEQPLRIDSILERLKQTPLFLRSIAYESASMAIAYLDFTSNAQDQQWGNFRSKTPAKHLWHVQIGLGLGYAKAGKWPDVDSEHNSLIYDGIGYYHALFSGRKTIKMQHVPSELSDEELSWFDVGIGRRLWYTAKGDPTELGALMMLFDETRQEKLWHGVGVACGYVGGIDAETLQQIAILATDYVQSFKLGFSLALTNRKGSNSRCLESEAAGALTFTT
ncbi:MAG: hypothetical protein ACI8SE_001586 [Bacteroidia bacterium]|jgi:hypothetical protein